MVRPWHLLAICWAWARGVGIADCLFQSEWMLLPCMLTCCTIKNRCRLHVGHTAGLVLFVPSVCASLLGGAESAVGVLNPDGFHLCVGQHHRRLPPRARELIGNAINLLHCGLVCREWFVAL